MTEILNTLSEHWYNWQIAMLWQTTVLIAIVWMVDLSIRKWAWPQVRYALWMLVLVKLLIPPTLTSPASITAHIPAVFRAAIVMERVSPPKPEPVFSNIQQGGNDITPVSDLTRAATVMEQVNNHEAPTEMERIDTAEQADVPISPAIHPSWKTYGMFTWLVGIVVLSIWLFRRLSGLRKEHLAPHQAKACHSGPRAGIQGDTNGVQSQARHDKVVTCPESFYTQLTAAANRLKLKRLPQVILTDRVSCPAVFGILRPVLLMPADKFKEMSTDETEHILLHELAHIKRGDLLVHGLYMTLQIVYWFNPLLWAIRRTLQNLRELCCDATVARLLKDDTVGYRQTLLQTARRLLAEPVDPGLGLLGLFENSNWLVTRLHWLEKKTWKNRPLRIATIITLVALMAVCVLPMANRPKPQYSVTLDNGVTVELVAVCNYPSDGKSWWTPNGAPCPLAITTEDHSGYTSQDPDYEFVFRKTGPLPFKIESVKGSDANSNLTVLQPAGLIGRRVHIKSRYKKTEIKIASPSGSWKTVLTSKSGQGSASATVSGKTIVLAGLVAAGPDVIVSCSDELGYKQASHIIVIDTDGTEHTGTVQTDTGVNNIRQRTLCFEGLGIDDIAEVRFQTCPNQYYTFKDVALRPDSEGPYNVIGTVTDASTGDPIAGAEVYDDGYNNSIYRTTTDEKGRFTLKTANEEHNISARAEDYQTQTKTLTTFPFANNEKFNFQLTPETKVEPSASRFTTTLGGGTTVQLVNVSSYPIAGKPGWTPAGDLLETPIESAPNPVSVYPITDDEQARLFTLTFEESGADDVRFRPRMPQAGYVFWVNAKKQIIAKFPASKQSCDLTLEVAAGPWKTVAFGGDGKTNAYTNDAMTDSGVIFYPAANENGHTVIRIANQLGKTADCRSVIYDKSKQLHEPLDVSNTGSDIASCECSFDLPADRIDHIELQTRPFETITFKDVALSPDLKTLVETEVQAPDDSGQESEEKARTSDIWKSIDKEGAEKLMNEYIKALVNNDASRIQEITVAATPQTQQLRLSLNEAEKLADVRAGASSYVKSKHTVLLVCGGSIKRIDGLRHSLFAVISLEKNAWILKDARWYRTYDIQTPKTILNTYALEGQKGLEKIASKALLDALQEAQLFEKLMPALKASGDLYKGPVFDGKKVSIAREDIAPIAIEFVDAMRNNDKSRMDALTPPSLREKLYRLSKICQMNAIEIDEIDANESFAIIVTHGVRRHDGRPHQLGFSFIVYPGGKWVFMDLDWLDTETRQIYIDSFRKNFPDAKTIALHSSVKTNTEVSMDKLVKSVSFENVPLRDALKMLGDMYKVNIIPSQAVAQDPTPVPVTTLYNVTFEEILNAVCDTTHIWQKKDNVIHVYTGAEYKALCPDEKTAGEIEEQN